MTATPVTVMLKLNSAPDMTLIPALMCVLEMRACNFTFTPTVHLSINFKLKGLGRRGAFDLFFSTHVISLRV